MINICRIVAAVCDRRAQETPMSKCFGLPMGIGAHSSPQAHPGRIDRQILLRRD